MPRIRDQHNPTVPRPLYGVDSVIPTNSRLGLTVVKQELFRPHLQKVVSGASNRSIKVAIIYKQVAQLKLFSPEKELGLHKTNDGYEWYRLQAMDCQFITKPEDTSNAMYSYIKCVAIAPFPEDIDDDSTVLAMAFANRAFYSYSLGKYEECLRDTNNALRYKYVDHLMYKIFTHRGNCFHVMGKCDDAKENYETALELHSSAFLLDSISRDSNEMYIAKRLAEIARGIKRKEEYKPKRVRPMPLVADGPSTEMLAASKCLALKYTNHFGRHLCATRDIKPGEVLIVEDPPTLMVTKNYQLIYCYNCLEQSVALIPCFHCQWVMFCNERCRREAWRKGHCIECRMMNLLRPVIYDPVMMATMQQFISAVLYFESLEELRYNVQNLPATSSNPRTKGFNESGKFTANDFAAVHHMQWHQDSFYDSDLYTLAVKAALLLNCFEQSIYFDELDDTEMKRFVGGLLLEYMMNNITNMEAIQSDIPKAVDSHVGSALYPTVKLLNHSCKPNAFKYSHGLTTVVVSCTPIAKGEQVFIDYFESSMINSYEDRMRDLTILYRFVCTCKYCKLQAACHQPLLPQGVKRAVQPLWRCYKCGAALYRPSGREPSSVRCSLCKVRVKVTTLESKAKEMAQKMEYLTRTAQTSNNMTELIAQVLTEESKYDNTPPEIMFEWIQLLKTNFQQLGKYFFDA